jgi:pimeloyl-ACP methyl ester carboxylesterase
LESSFPATNGLHPFPERLIDRRTLWHRVRRIWITLGLSATAVFTVWSLLAYRASDDARAAIVSSESVAVTHADGVWTFTPTRASSLAPVALVFFPGSLVDPVAYAPIVRAAADSGIPSYIVELPRRGAFGGGRDPAFFEKLIAFLEGDGVPKRWVAAGHSLGGVVATNVAMANVQGLAGLVLIGTSHPRDVDLSALTMPVTKIVGTLDGLASREEVEGNARLVPKHTRWIWIEGGNHSQFGWYGFQPGDSRATIDRASQHAQTIAGTLDALRAVAANTPP